MLTHRLPVIVETKGGIEMQAEYDASADELRFVPDPDPEESHPITSHEYREWLSEPGKSWHSDLDPDPCHVPSRSYDWDRVHGSSRSFDWDRPQQPR